ncbi:PREDICTED: rho guanine nucleotide exchange factor 5 [Chrysochloris asiatica]|uniref:Rho guanine nucleotide exchange factor 5 n=1 Tax=Chrysochloris asiatica TaxID=185453 RepID=A0A9B0WLS4_CHRAS|nr:PREDICTED: rho guanine nucleotide exchange factor 5 [Chrysochloris asiatica]
MSLYNQCSSVSPGTVVTLGSWASKGVGSMFHVHNIFSPADVLNHWDLETSHTESHDAPEAQSSGTVVGDVALGPHPPICPLFPAWSPGILLCPVPPPTPETFVVLPSALQPPSVSDSAHVPSLSPSPCIQAPLDPCSRSPGPGSSLVPCSAFNPPRSPDPFCLSIEPQPPDPFNPAAPLPPVLYPSPLAPLRLLPGSPAPRPWARPARADAAASAPMRPRAAAPPPGRCAQVSSPGTPGRPLPRRPPGLRGTPGRGPSRAACERPAGRSPRVAGRQVRARARGAVTTTCRAAGNGARGPPGGAGSPGPGRKGREPGNALPKSALPAGLPRKWAPVWVLAVPRGRTEARRGSPWGGWPKPPSRKVRGTCVLVLFSAAGPLAPAERDPGSRLMEASEPPHRALTPTPTILELGETSEALLRGSRTPTLEPRATESPTCEGVEGCRPSDTLWGELRDVSDLSTERVSPSPKEEAASEETAAPESWAANSQARRPTHPELWDPGDSLDMVSVPRELLAGGADQTEASPGSPAPSSSGPPWGEHPAGTPLLLEKTQGRCEQVGWETQGQLEVGVQGVPEPMEKQVNGKGGEERQEGLGIRELGGLIHGPWRPQSPRLEGPGEERVSLESEEEGVDTQPEKPEGVPGKQQNQSLGGEVIPVEGWEEEAGGQTEGGLKAEEEQAQQSGVTCLAPVALGTSPPCGLFPEMACPQTRAPRTQTDPWLRDVSPPALSPSLEPGQTHLPMSLPCPFPEEETSQEGQQEEPKQGTEAKEGSTSPWTLPTGSGGKALPAAGSPEDSKAFLCRAPETPTGSPTHSPPASPSGTALHPRSNSFPGPHRTELPPDLVVRSLSFSHSELPQRPPKPAIYGSVTPRRDRRGGRDNNIPLEPTAASPPTRQGPGLPSSRHSWSPTANPPLVSVDGRAPKPPPPLHMRRVRAPTLQRYSHPPTLAFDPGSHGPLKDSADHHLVARQLWPLPSTPDSPPPAQTSLPPRQRYNKPLPPTPPDAPQSGTSGSTFRSLRTYKPLPPLPTLDPATEPPPLPPKLRSRSRSTQGPLMSTGGRARSGAQDWAAPLTPSAGRTSWPPATGQSADPLAPTSRGRNEMTPSMAFSNIINLLSPLSPTAEWSAETGSWLVEEPESPNRGPSRRMVPQEGTSNLRGLELGHTRPPERPGHLPLEKASSWPHRRDPGRPPVGGSAGPAPGEGPSKNKSWNRQGLRRPSILPEGTSDTRGPAMEHFPGPSDAIVFREKKPKESSGFTRRCSKLINSSQLLYQEYSDVFLNKEIQSQQRLDSLAETPGPASPRQRRKAFVSSESYVQRLSSTSSSSLWQEIPVVRNSTVLLSMTHADQKLQEAKFELIVSEASYLRSLHVAVDHFQLSTQLRATLSNQEHQWLFSRLQDVRDVSTTFLSDLEENFENNIFTFHVCDVVLNHTPHFRRVYLPYVTNQTYQERTFQSLLNGNSHFREVLDKLESDPVCQRLSLKSFLILPFQRITRLKLLLQNILKRTQPGSSEEAEATKAHHALEELIRDCNSNVQRMRRTEELIYLSQKIEFECRIFPLISQSRWLVKSGELTALEFSMTPGLRRKLTTRPVHLHLFNDCLLLSRPREGSRFLVFDHAPFSEVRGEKCEMKLHGAHKNLFRLFLLHNTQGTQAEFLFSTETQSEKLRWISALALPREEQDLLQCYESQQVQCLRAYKSRENDELSLEKADVVMVIQQSSDGWLEGVKLSDGERGWFPLKQVEFIWNPDVRARNLKEAQRVKTARLQLVGQEA